jgi:hypothetical protein
MPAGFLGVRTAPDTSTPAADKKGPHAGMGVPEGLGDRLGETLKLAVMLSETDAVAVTAAVTEGEMLAEGVTVVEKEGSGGPTKTDVALTTAPE